MLWTPGLEVQPGESKVWWRNLQRSSRKLFKVSMEVNFNKDSHQNAQHSSIRSVRSSVVEDIL